MPKLVVLSQGLAGLSYELKTDKITVGRVEDNSFQVSDPSVSSHHCEILLKGTEVIVRDLNSTNGTFINGKEVKGEASIPAGQVLRLGQIEIRVEGIEGSPAKKAVDRTQIIGKGVKIDDLGTTQPTSFAKDSPFAKKSNSGTKLFIVGAIVLGVVIIGFIIMAIMQSGSITQGP